MLCTAILNHQGATYKTDMYRNVLLAAPHIVPVQHVGTSAALHLLGNFPVHSVAIGGDLNVAARQYISGTAQSSMGTGYVEGSANRNLCQDLLQAWQRFDVDWPRSKAFSEKDIQVGQHCVTACMISCTCFHTLTCTSAWRGIDRQSRRRHALQFHSCPLYLPAYVPTHLYVPVFMLCCRMLPVFARPLHWYVVCLPMMRQAGTW